MQIELSSSVHSRAVHTSKFTRFIWCESEANVLDGLRIDVGVMLFLSTVSGFLIVLLFFVS